MTVFDDIKTGVMHVRPGGEARGHLAMAAALAMSHKGANAWPVTVRVYQAGALLADPRCRGYVEDIASSGARAGVKVRLHGVPFTPCAADLGGSQLLVDAVADGRAVTVMP